MGFLSFSPTETPGRNIGRLGRVVDALLTGVHSRAAITYVSAKNHV